MPIEKSDQPEVMDLTALAQEDRLNFIRKVYSILTVQLSITAGAVTAVKLNPELDETFQSPTINGISIGLLVAAIFIQCALLC